MIDRPTVGAKYRSVLTGNTARVKDVQGSRVTLLDTDGNTVHIHVRDFNAEYRTTARSK